MKNPESDSKYVVRADFYGDIPSNLRKRFWLPLTRGNLCLSSEKVYYREFSACEDSLEVEFTRIIKIKMQSLDPGKNQWSGRFGNPYYLMFWNPFWNRYVINFTYLAEDGLPHEIFFKLKTKKITVATMNILKKMLSQSVVADP